ncbi:MAG: two-component system response regulator CreB [Verrucomicrobiaceae bacterium]|jgi:two-component system catabolic regulation response regulator CreB|nr:two-component system response regulator CreB [Verrucomicrobiaceae bacterium]
MSRRVLVVEDEPSIAETIWYALRTEGFDVSDAATGGDALSKLASESFDCLILDVGLPDMSGFDVCRTLRQSSSVPILFLTARDSEIDRIVGLELGADDYVAKPFSPRELAARVRAILRRTNATPKASPPTPNTAPPSTLDHDPLRKVIRCAGQSLDLSRNEYHLLLALMKNPGRVLTRDQLMDLAWQDPGTASDRTVDAHIKSVRSKIRALTPDFDPIETRRGLGYALRE